VVVFFVAVVERDLDELDARVVFLAPIDSIWIWVRLLRKPVWRR
jgi:hypothetical protein